MKKIFIILIVISSIAYLFIICIKKYQFQNKNNTVEICVDYNQIIQLCQTYNYPEDNFFERIKTIGVSSVILEEDNFETFIKRDYVYFLTDEEAKKLKFLELLAPGSIINDDTLIISNIKKAKEYINFLYSKKLNPPIYNFTSKYGVFNLKNYQYLKKIGFGFDDQKISLLKKHNLFVVLKLLDDKTNWFPENIPENISCILVPVRNNHIPQIYLEKLIINNLKFPFFEFSKNEYGIRTDLQKIYKNVIRAHSIDLDDLKINEPEILIKRLIRAVRERNCRFLYFYFNSELDIENNLNYLRNLYNELKNKGYKLSVVQLPRVDSLVEINPFIGKFFGFIISVFIPVYGIIFIKNRNYINTLNIKFTKNLEHFLLISSFSIIGGIIINILLTNYKFFVKVDEFTGIKIVFILPFLISIFIVYSFKDLNNFFNENIKVKNFIFLTLIVVFWIVLIIRSGNYSFLTASNFEIKLRLFLENLLIVRPRLKEFLIGHPAMILGMKNNSKLLVLIGIIGQISIINTFLHSHIPIEISVLRVFYGLCLGMIMSIIYYYIYLYFWKNFYQTH